MPDWQSSQAGPFDLWPTGLGFEKFYGFIGGETNQWRPAAFDGTKPIEPYLGNPDCNFDYDIADQATTWVRTRKAVAMAGMNGSPENPDEILKHKDDLGTWKKHNHYPIAWAHAMDTPFRWTKQIASHYGGTRNAMVVSWPARIKDRGEIRSQWHHTIDIVPTLLDVTHIEQPSSVDGVAQKPIEGVSMAYTFDNPQAPSARRTQYFEFRRNDEWLGNSVPRLSADPEGAFRRSSCWLYQFPWRAS